MAPPKKRLGDILLEMGVVDALQLRAALGHHRQWGMPLGQTLVERRICSMDQVLAALARQTGLPLIALDAHPLEGAPTRLVPRAPPTSGLRTVPSAGSRSSFSTTCPEGPHRSGCPRR